MIRLTRLNGLQFYLNAELIKTVESSPDTTITLVNGEKLVIGEALPEVVQAVVAYKREIAGGAIELKLPTEMHDEET
jgi:flagellar protein FlbD